jgi:helicase required for RNAi-mediated heterochromatin assembly 1
MMQCSVTLNCGHHCMGTYTGLSLVFNHTNQSTEVCCDDCKCRRCDRRVNGQRSMLKAPKATATYRAPPSGSRGLLLDSGFQTPANPPPQSQPPDKWQVYVNGGAKEDDARMLQERKEENAVWEEQRRDSTLPLSAHSAADAGPNRLIETSPQRPAPCVSGSTGLLLNLNIKSTYGAYSQQSSRASFVTTVESQKTSYGGSQFSLLD